MTSTTHRQRLAAADRAQVVQIAAILLFGMAILAFAAYQATVVPQQNARVEFQHSQVAEQGMEHARAGIQQTARTGNTHPVTFPLGTRYPDRFLAVNPPPASGRLRTIPQQNVTVENAVTVSGISLGGLLGTSNGLQYRTRALTYQASYNVYNKAPVVRFGGSVLYERYGNPGGTSYVLSSGQRLVNGSDIYLTTLHGRLNTTATGTATIDTRPLSAPANPVEVRSESTGPLQVTVPTQLPEKFWAKLLASETGADGNVSSADCNGTVTPTSSLDDTSSTPCGTLELEFEPGTYTLHAAAIGVGTVSRSVDAPAYLVSVEGNTTYVPEETRHQVVVEVRDRYNNPVSGVTVNATVVSGNGVIVENNTVTNEDGRATIVYRAPAVGSDTTEQVEIAFDNALNGGGRQYSSPKDVRIDLYVQDTGGGGGGGTSSSVLTASNPIIVEGGAGLQFDLSNTGSSNAKIQRFSVSSNVQVAQLHDKNGTANQRRELVIDIQGNAGEADSATGYATDGTMYALTDQAQINSGSTATVTIKEFRDVNGNLVTYSSASLGTSSNYDIAVTFELGSGTTDTYYFQLS